MSQFKIKGVQSELEVFDDKLTITPKGVLGFFNQGLKGEKTIPFRSITAIQLKKAGMTSGYIQFSVLGGNESRGGILKATQDENTFMYSSAKDNQTIQAIKEYVEARLGSAPSAAVPQSETRIADELAKLADMKAQGMLTEEEFARAKGRLMKSNPPGPGLEGTAAGGAIAQPVAVMSPQDGLTEKAKKKGETGKWIAFVLLVLVLAINLPWLGLLTGLVFVGLAGAVLAKKLARSAFAFVAKAQAAETGRVAKLARLEAAFGVLVLIMSASAASSAAEKESARKAAAVAAAEAAAQQKAAQDAKMKALTASLPRAVDAAISSLSRIDQQIKDGDFDGALQAITKEVNGLSPYQPLQSGSAELKTALEQLETRQRQVSGVVNARAFGRQASVAAETGDGQVKAKAYLQADASYQSALDFLAKIDPAQVEQADVEGLQEAVEKKKARIARNVKKARAAAEKAAAKAAAIAKAEEAKKARQFSLGNFYYWIERPKFKSCIGNRFVRECSGPGATFVVVPYVMENTGKATETIISSDFEIQDAEGRSFKPSSRAETAMAMSGGSKDLILSQLQPGVQKRMSVVFEIPESAQNLKLVVPKKGLLSVSKKVIPL